MAESKNTNEHEEEEDETENTAKARKKSARVLEYVNKRLMMMDPIERILNVTSLSISELEALTKRNPDES
jgi:ATP:corrinoid adenosyltransferase